MAQTDRRQNAELHDFEKFLILDYARNDKFHGDRSFVFLIVYLNIKFRAHFRLYAEVLCNIRREGDFVYLLRGAALGDFEAVHYSQTFNVYEPHGFIWRIRKSA